MLLSMLAVSIGTLYYVASGDTASWTLLDAESERRKAWGFALLI